jgi:hypothetical protein
MPRSVEFLSILARPLQRCFFAAVQDVLSQHRRLYGSGNRDNDENAMTAFEALYVLVSCRIAGVGCERSPKEAFKLLLEISNLTSFRSLFGSAIVLSLRDALIEKGGITPDEAEAALNATLTAAGNEALPALRWLKDCIPDALEHPQLVEMRDKGRCQAHHMVPSASEIRDEKSLLQYIDRFGEDFEANHAVFGHGNTILHAAALFGDAEMIKDLTNRLGCDVNSSNELGETPFLIACKHGRSQEALQLIRLGTNFDTPTGESLFHYLPLMASKDVPLLLEAFQRGAVKAHGKWCAGALDQSNNFIFFDRIKGDAMLRAIGTHRIDVVKALVSMSDIPHTLKGRKAFLAPSIEVAAQLHSSAILKYLLSTVVADGPLEGRSVGKGWTVDDENSLMRHVLSGESSMERITLHGKRFHNAAKETLEVLHEFGFIEIFLSLRGQVKSTLVAALETANDDMATMLLDFGTIVNSINIPDPDTGLTPLHVCIRQGARSTFSRMIDVGAEFKQGIAYPPGSSNQVSYLHVCASHGADNWFPEALLDAGLSVDSMDGNGCPALHLALMRQSYQLAKLLMDRGSSLNQVVNGGYTVTGMLFAPAFREHHNDFLGALE